MNDQEWVDRFTSLFLIIEQQTCSCGDRQRPHINHRKKIACWTYVGNTRVDIDNDGRLVFASK